MKGSGTRTTSPISWSVVIGAVVAVPDLGEGVLGDPAGGACELPSTMALGERADGLLDLAGLVRREALDLHEELLLGVVGRAPSTVRLCVSGFPILLPRKGPASWRPRTSPLGVSP